MRLTDRLAPDFTTTANFRKDNGKAISKVCRQFVVLCQRLHPSSDAVVVIDGSKFKSVNSSDRNFTNAKLKRRIAENEANISPYLAELDTADRHEPATAQSKKARLNDKIAVMKLQMEALKEIEANRDRRNADFAHRSGLALNDNACSGIVGYNAQPQSMPNTI